jgi:hypothetical protein
LQNRKIGQKIDIDANKQNHNSGKIINERQEKQRIHIKEEQRRKKRNNQRMNILVFYFKMID